jgi:hypothetical protein
MKTTILIISFTLISIFGNICNAQKTFVEKYTYYVTNVKDKISEPKYATITIIFNEGDTTDIVVYATDEPKRFYRTGKTTNGKTNGGYEYQVVTCIDSETGKEVQIQLFDDACRIFIGVDYIEYDK